MQSSSPNSRLNRWFLRGLVALSGLALAAQVFPVGATDGRAGLSAFASLYESAARTAAQAWDRGAQLIDHAQLAYQLLSLSGNAPAASVVSTPAPAARPMELCKEKKSGSAQPVRRAAVPQEMNRFTGLPATEAEIKTTLAGLFAETLPVTLKISRMEMDLQMQEMRLHEFEKRLVALPNAQAQSRAAKILVRVLRPNRG